MSIRAAHPMPRLDTVELERAYSRLHLGPVPLRWVRTAAELDALRRLAIRGLAEFDRSKKSYVLKEVTI